MSTSPRAHHASLTEAAPRRHVSVMNLSQHTALVTGASSGLGEAFARRLAAMGADIIITARRKDRLETLAADLRTHHGVQVTVLPLDLSAPGAARELHAQTEGAGRRVDVLINNAGFGVQDRFVDIPWEKTAEQLQLNVVALTELTWLFARDMKARGRGYILNVSSIGAFLPSPFYATYSAGKAYVRDFTEAIAHELEGTGVQLTALCPGLTQTEFHQVAGHKLDAPVRAVMMSAEKCADIGLQGLFHGERTVIPGMSNKLPMFLLRFVPRRAMATIANLAAGKRGA
ncbi:MAG: SDR family oxidoreductase [Myxococcota bacterium]